MPAKKGHGEKRSRLEDKAIVALLNAPTIKQAAKDAGVSERTLRGWLSDPAFAGRYRAAARESYQLALGALRAAGSEAAETLRALLKSNDEKVRAQAARTIMDQGLKSLEAFEMDELAEQVREVRAQLEEQKGGRDGFAK